MGCHVFVIMDYNHEMKCLKCNTTWWSVRAYSLPRVQSIHQLPRPRGVTMNIIMKPMMMIIIVAMTGPGAWFYSQPLLQTVCFTKELYRVSLRLNMIYTNLHIWVFFVFYLMVSIVLVRVNAKEQFCWPTYFLIWLELSSTQVPPLPLLPVKLTLQFFGSFF